MSLILLSSWLCCRYSVHIKSPFLLRFVTSNQTKAFILQARNSSFTNTSVELILLNKTLL